MRTMAKLRRMLLLIGWLVPASTGVTTSQTGHPRTQKRMRKVLPLDHHHRNPAKYHRLLQNSRPGSGGNGGSNIIDVGSWDDNISGDGDSHHGRSGRNKGFLGEAVELMKGGASGSRRDGSTRGGSPRGNTPRRRSHRGASRPGKSTAGNSHPGNSRAGNSHPGNSHPGNSHPGNSHPGNSFPGNSHPGNGHHAYDSGKSEQAPEMPKTNIPTLSPIIYPTYHSSSSSSSSTSKSKSKSKSKGKGKGGKGKGKGDSSSDDCDSSSSSSEDCGDPMGPMMGGPPGADTMMPTMAPSPAMPPAPNVVELTPFGILFDLEDGLGTPSSEEYGMAIEVTVGYLNTYMSLQYEGQGLVDFTTEATSTIYREGVPQIDFVAQATFENVEPPAVEVLDNSVAEAFVGANLALYLSMLNNLPPSNPFSTASGARLTNPAGTARRSSGLIGSVSAVGKAGIAGAIGAGGLILFAIGFLVYDKQQKQIKRKPIMPGIGNARTPHHRRATSNHNYGGGGGGSSGNGNGRGGGKVNPNKIGSDGSDETNTMCEATTTCSATVYSESTARSGISKFFPLSENLKIIPSIPMPMSINKKTTLDSEKEALEPKQEKYSEIETEAEDSTEAEDEDSAIVKGQNESVVTKRSGLG